MTYDCLLHGVFLVTIIMFSLELKLNLRFCHRRNNYRNFVIGIIIIIIGVRVAAGLGWQEGSRGYSSADQHEPDRAYIMLYKG